MVNRIPTSLFLLLIFLCLISTGHGLCSKDQIHCDITKCINILLRCDGKINCDDFSDELHCDMKGPKTNVTNQPISAKSTSSTTMPSNMTTSPPTPSKNQNTRASSPKKSKKNKYTKNIKKRIYFDNNTKEKKKRQYYNGTPAQLPIKSSIMTTDITSSEVQTKNVGATPVTQCSVEECVKWEACWRDIERSHRCACDEAACSQGLKTSAYAGNANERKTKDVFEWVIISVSSTCLIVAIIVLLLKRRRLHQTTATPLHVRTVVCYHHGHEESSCQGRNSIIRGHGKASTENHPLCVKAGCPSLVAEDEENVCYIDLTGQLKRNK